MFLIEKFSSTISDAELANISNYGFEYKLINSYSRDGTSLPGIISSYVSDAQYSVILDDECEIRSDFLDKAVAVLNTTDQIDIIAGHTKQLNEDNNMVNFYHGETPSFALVNRNIVPTMSVVRTDLILEYFPKGLTARAWYSLLLRKIVINGAQVTLLPMIAGYEKPASERKDNSKIMSGYLYYALGRKHGLPAFLFALDPTEPPSLELFEPPKVFFDSIEQPEKDYENLDVVWISKHYSELKTFGKLLNFSINHDRWIDDKEYFWRCMKKIKFAPPIEPTFDDSKYLLQHNDVMAAVAAKKFKSGYHHYITFGKTEGRERTNK